MGKQVRCNVEQNSLERKLLPQLYSRNKINLFILFIFCLFIYLFFAVPKASPTHEISSRQQQPLHSKLLTRKQSAINQNEKNLHY